MRHFALSALSALSALIGLAALPGPAPILRTVADVPMPGQAVRFDYQSLDTAANRLYLAHMNAGQLVVFDVKTRTVVKALDGFERVRGVIAVPEEGRVYASAWAGIRSSRSTRRPWR